MHILDYLCGDPVQVLDTSDALNATSSLIVPHVDECVQHTLLVLIPCTFLLLFLPIVLYALYKSDNGRLKPCTPATLRIINCVFLLCNSGLLFFYFFYQWLRDDTGEYSLTRVSFSGLLYLTLAITLVLTVACRNRGVITSGVLFNFWLLLAVCGLPEFRYKLHALLDDEADRFDALELWLYMTYYPVVVLTFLLSCFADIPRYHHVDKKACPELMTSFLNQITFHWFTSMAILGNRRALEMDDLWELNARDRSKHLVDKWERVWDKHAGKFHAKRRAQPTAKQDKGTSLPVNGSPETLLLDETERHAKAEEKKDHPSLLWPLAQTFKWPFLAGALYKFVFDLLQFVSPQLLRMLINFIEDRKQPMWIGVSISLLMFIIALLQSMILHQYFHNMFRLGMNIRSVLTSAVYRKALLLSNSARKNRTVGEIVNLMSVDIQRLQDITTFIMLFWSAPLQVSLSIYFLYRLLGVAVVAGLFILIALVPVNSWLSVKMRNYQVEQMKYKDERVKMMSEILNGMKVLKLYAWEESMQKAVLEVRKKELVVLRKLAFLNAATALSWSCAPFLVAVLTFGLYVTIDPVNNVLTPEVTFVALSLFNILRFPLAVFAMIFSQAIQCSVSNKRLKAFLDEEEIETPALDGSVPRDTAISIRHGCFSWDHDAELTLKDINVQIPKGSLVAIVGRIGSGKSSLLSAILSEMHRRAGAVNVQGRVAYVPQQAWIQNLTLKANILFSRGLNPTLYQQVIDACSLTSDLLALPAGDETEIGEKGINLSGGQKQRVSLARAIYAESDIYLLDDPLSAVDAHVGKFIFENVIDSKQGILKDKTRVFVTHGLAFLSRCDQILVIKDGQVSESGTYDQLMANSGEFADIIEEFLIEETRNRGRSVSFGEDADEVKEVLADLEKADPAKCERLRRQISQKATDSAVGSLDEGDDASKEKFETARDAPAPGTPTTKTPKAAETPVVPTVPAKAVANGTTEKSKLIEKEGIQTGKVKFLVYLSYIRAIGYGITTAFFFIYVISSALGVWSNLWLADWSDHAKEIQANGTGSYETNVRLGIYTGLGMGQALFVTIASVVMALGMVMASSTLHEGMLSNMLRSTMSFFDVTPLGRILNRFSKDVDMMDTRVPGTVINFVSCVVQGIAILCVPMIVTPAFASVIAPTIAVYILLTDIDGLDTAIPRSLMSMVRTAIASIEIIAVIVWATPSFLAVIGPLLFIYACVLRFYVSTSRQLKRLESTTRSPIYSHFQESIQGASSIRAYQCVDRFLLESQRRMDYNLLAYYPSIVANRWLAVRLELVGNFIVLCSALFAALFRDTSGVTAGLVGLSVSYALNVTQTLNWAVRMTSELETNIVAVERIKEYTDDTPNEAQRDTPRDVKLPAEWPEQGRIEFKDLQLRYRADLDLVLKGISANIEPQEKVGIIGRTGAGKSSLTLALFRLVEPSSGTILIDGVDITKIGLYELRSRLTIVPQDPVLFSGTLRFNLDPFAAYADDKVWEALRLTHMEGFVSTLPDKLQHKIDEGGGNLSVGQRQLICLTRALLRKSKILILDEAAASVDMETDQLIQRTIREQFSDCTVLTIAHRLHSVLECDRLLVLDDGRVVEFDAPQTLLANPESLFRAMAADAGIAPK